MPLVKRSFFISCRGDECLKLIEVLRSSLNVNEATVSISEGGIIIELYGYKTDIKRSWSKSRKVVRAFKKSLKH
ncbi:MAG: DUF2067 domain-containing protein [Sulfolobales archaeon]|nr:DUF2067 domain-containing protein [Sulfolobales archaeon]MCX8199138.1 DUF2067 domain-containing protein [Sulfolobales archaeon]MDW8170117.1 DUF2067 family protein [Desulfurococcaceae archaeon]